MFLRTHLDKGAPVSAVAVRAGAARREAAVAAALASNERVMCPVTVHLRHTRFFSQLQDSGQESHTLNMVPGTVGTNVRNREIACKQEMAGVSVRGHDDSFCRALSSCT